VYGWSVRSVAMAFDVDPDGRRCTMRLSGSITYADLEAGIDAQIASGAWTYQTVIDTLAADGILTRYDDARQVLSTIQSRSAHLPPRGPIVIVVGDHPAIFGMARMYQAMAANEAGLRVEIVRSVGDIDGGFARLALR
jgi:hypothetical protein